MGTDRKARELLVAFIISCIVSLPLFFDIFRTMAFNTVPRDDYAHFLLYFTSDQGTWPGSPFGYRFLSMLAAVPFYWALPVYRFTSLPPIDTHYLRAVEALAFLSFISICGSAALAFATARKAFDANLGQASFAAACMIVLSGFSGRVGIDPFGICVIFLLLDVFETPILFSAVMSLLVPFINEKILLFFVFLTISRALVVSNFLVTHKLQVGSTIAGLLVYVTALLVVRLPGSEYQTSVTQWLPHIGAMLWTSVSSLKGLQLNLLYSWVVIGPCVLFSLYSEAPTSAIKKCDFVVPIGLFVVALATTVGVTVGHVVSYALPVTVLSFTALVCQYDRKHWKPSLNTGYSRQGGFRSDNKAAMEPEKSNSI